MGKLLGIKPTDKEIKKYCTDIEDLYKLGQTKEGAVVSKFASLLSFCAKKVDWLLSSEYVIKRIGKRPDGAFLDQYSVSHGIMEAKDDDDDLVREAKNKFAIGYPRENTIFWQPNRIIIYQNDKKVFDAQIGRITKDLVGSRIEHPAESRSSLAQALNMFFEFEPPHYEQWLEAAEAFKKAVPELSAGLLEKINQSKKDNKTFVRAFAAFRELCQQSINPNISDTAIEEMIIQHLLTERLLRKVFDMDRFTQDNTIARQLEEVISAMTGQFFNRKEFLGSLDGFYKSIEAVAEDIEDFSEKQAFINSIYEKFFQGWAVKSADTLGIVYTPQPVVDFMVRSVEEILKKEFGKSLSSPNVHILDPFVGTGNFIVRTMKEIHESKPTALEDKYKFGLHCNEIALMPYYIASMNIEHEFTVMNAKKYLPFSGICFADTFQMFEDTHYLGFAQAENSERVKKQIEKPIFVVITNPPYNTQQANENDNNKNRRYVYLEKAISETYAKDSKATLKNKLSDPYVKAIKWASKRIGDEGVVAVITNNSFIDNFAFDGMRKHLARDFDKIYVLDLGGNVRKNPKLSGTTHNVFGIQVGVSINLLVKKSKDKQSFASLDKGGARRAVGSDKDNNNLQNPPTPLNNGGNESSLDEGEQDNASGVFYARLDEFWRKEQKYEWLNEKRSVYNVAWKKLVPNEQNVWLTEGLAEDFDGFLPIGNKTKEYKEHIFDEYSLGIVTSRDSHVYSFNINNLKIKVTKFIEIYNKKVDELKSRNELPLNIEDFIDVTNSNIKWTRQTKGTLLKKEYTKFDEKYFKNSIYRPFTKKYVYWDDFWIEERYQTYKFFPTFETESENIVICATGIGSEKPFMVYSTNLVSDLHLVGAGCANQTFPFYTYNEDGTGRRENITDWSLSQFRQHYRSASLDKGGARRAEGSEVENIDIQNPPTPLIKGGNESSLIKGGNERPLIKRGNESSLAKENNTEPPYPPYQGGLKMMPSQGGLSKENIILRAKQYGYVWNEGFLPYNPKLLDNAKQLRKNMTPAERKLWYEFLKDNDFKFLRQHPIDNYIVDFYCSNLHLVIEVDGNSHDEPETIKNDNQRDDTLKNIYGLSVIRISNEDVMKNFEGVSQMLDEKIKNSPNNKNASLDKGGARRAEGSEVENIDIQNPPTPLIKGGNESSLIKGGNESSLINRDYEQEITKWDIFYYVYAMLHHPGYREEYKENLRRSLPRIPYAPDFWAFAKIGKQLADLHVNYEKVEPYGLETVEDSQSFREVGFRIKKMKLTADKTQLVYNEAITFTGIPKEVHDYKLGNRSALEWIVDQYQVTTDPRSGITQDPNDFDGDPRYIFNLVGRIVTVSLETVRLVGELEKLPYKN